MNNILQDYPKHKAFEELLNSCGSMTRQLENMGHTLTVELIKEGIIGDYFCRYTILKLDNTPVIFALSHSKLNSHKFINILKNANNIPIGRFLFAKDSQIVRNKIAISKVFINNVSDIIIKTYLETNYNHEQVIFSRESEFISAENEKMILVEIILPEFKKFFKS